MIGHINRTNQINESDNQSHQLVGPINPIITMTMIKLIIIEFDQSHDCQTGLVIDQSDLNSL